MQSRESRDAAAAAAWVQANTHHAARAQTRAYQVAAQAQHAHQAAVRAREAAQWQSVQNMQMNLAYARQMAQWRAQMQHQQQQHGYSQSWTGNSHSAYDPYYGA